MGYVVRVKSVAEKASLCDYLRKKGLSQRPTPFRTRGETMLSICVFKDHFYSAHFEDVDFITEGESMIECTVDFLKRNLKYDRITRKSAEV